MVDSTSATRLQSCKPNSPVPLAEVQLLHHVGAWTETQIVPRIANLTDSLAIWIFANDHAPPHFHVMAADTDETDVMIDLQTLQVMRGNYKRKHLATALAWAAEPTNYQHLVDEWSRLNEQD